MSLGMQHSSARNLVEIFTRSVGTDPFDAFRAKASIEADTKPNHNTDYMKDINPGKTFEVPKIKAVQVDVNKKVDLDSLPNTEVMTADLDRVEADFTADWDAAQKEVGAHLDHATMNTPEALEAGIKPGDVRQALFPNKAGASGLGAAAGVAASVAFPITTGVTAVIDAVHQANKQVPQKILDKIVNQAVTSLQMNATEREAKVSQGVDLPPEPKGDYSKFDAVRLKEFCEANIEDQPVMQQIQQARLTVEDIEQNNEFVLENYDKVGVSAEKIFAALDSGDEGLVKSLSGEESVIEAIAEITNNEEVIQQVRTSQEVELQSDTLADLKGVQTLGGANMMSVQNAAINLVAINGPTALQNLEAEARMAAMKLQTTSPMGGA